MSAAEIPEQIRHLPVAEQYEVAERAHEECGGISDELTPEQIAEFERRADELRKDPRLGIPWEQVRAEAKQRLKARRAA